MGEMRAGSREGTLLRLLSDVTGMNLDKRCVALCPLCWQDNILRLCMHDHGHHHDGTLHMCAHHGSLGEAERWRYIDPACIIDFRSLLEASKPVVSLNYGQELKFPPPTALTTSSGAVLYHFPDRTGPGAAPESLGPVSEEVLTDKPGVFGTVGVPMGFIQEAVESRQWRYTMNDGVLDTVTIQDGENSNRVFCIRKTSLENLSKR